MVLKPDTLDEKLQKFPTGEYRYRSPKPFSVDLFQSPSRL